MYTDPTVHRRYLEGQNIAVKHKKMHTQTLIIYVTDWHLYSESRNEKKVSLQQTPNSLAEFINKRTIWYDQRYSLLAETNKHTDTKKKLWSYNWEASLSFSVNIFSLLSSHLQNICYLHVQTYKIHFLLQKYQTRKLKKQHRQNKWSSSKDINLVVKDLKELHNFLLKDFPS
jgi:hypothetical protein